MTGPVPDPVITAVLAAAGEVVEHERQRLAQGDETALINAAVEVGRATAGLLVTASEVQLRQTVDDDRRREILLGTAAAMLHAANTIHEDVR